MAAIAMAARIQGREVPDFPKTTAIGALGLYISDSRIENFQPMNINFSILAPLEQRIRKKAEKNLAIANRGLEVLEEVCPLSARMIVNPVSMRMENERIKELLTKLRTVLQEG